MCRISWAIYLFNYFRKLLLSPNLRSSSACPSTQFILSTYGVLSFLSLLTSMIYFRKKWQSARDSSSPLNWLPFLWAEFSVHLNFFPCVHNFTTASINSYRSLACFQINSEKCYINWTQKFNVLYKYFYNSKKRSHFENRMKVNCVNKNDSEYSTRLNSQVVTGTTDPLI